MAGDSVLAKFVNLIGFRLDKASMAEAKAGIEGLKGVMRDTARTTQDVGNSLQRYVMGAFKIATLVKFTQQLVTVNMEFEALRSRLVTILQSEALGGQVFERLVDWARTTPSTVQQAINAWTMMATTGFRATIDEMTALGNIAGAMQKPVDALGLAVARARTGLYRNLRMFGIHVRDLGSQLQVTAGGLTEVIDDNRDAMTQWLVRIGSSTYAGGMERMMRTMLGQASNLKDTWSILLYMIGRAGVNDAIRELLVSLQGVVRAGGQFITAVAKPLVWALKTTQRIVEWIAPRMRALAAIVGLIVLDRFISGLGQANSLAMRLLGIINMWWIAIVLIVDDLVHFFRGAPSFLGTYLKPFTSGVGWRGKLLEILEFCKNSIGKFFQDIVENWERVYLQVVWDLQSLLAIVGGETQPQRIARLLQFTGQHPAFVPIAEQMLLTEQGELGTTYNPLQTPNLTGKEWAERMLSATTGLASLRYHTGELTREQVDALDISLADRYRGLWRQFTPYNEIPVTAVDQPVPPSRRQRFQAGNFLASEAVGGALGQATNASDWRYLDWMRSTFNTSQLTLSYLLGSMRAERRDQAARNVTVNVGSVNVTTTREPIAESARAVTDRVQASYREALME